MFSRPCDIWLVLVSRGGFSYRRYRRSPRAPLRGGRKKLRPATNKKTRIMFLFCWTEFFCAPFYISNQYFDIKTKHKISQKSKTEGVRTSLVLSEHASTVRRPGRNLRRKVRKNKRNVPRRKVNP